MFIGIGFALSFDGAKKPISYTFSNKENHQALFQLVLIHWIRRPKPLRLAEIVIDDLLASIIILF